MCLKNLCRNSMQWKAPNIWRNPKYFIQFSFFTVVTMQSCSLYGAEGYVKFYRPVLIILMTVSLHLLLYCLKPKILRWLASLIRKKIIIVFLYNITTNWAPEKYFDQKWELLIQYCFLDEKSSQQPTNDGINGKKRPAMDPGS